MFYGLSIIAGAWLLQWWFARRGQRSLQSWTLRFLALGFLVLVFETFDKAKIWRSIPAILSLVLILILLRKHRH
jgi:hypothetical protein